MKKSLFKYKIILLLASIIFVTMEMSMNLRVLKYLTPSKLIFLLMIGISIYDIFKNKTPLNVKLNPLVNFYSKNKFLVIPIFLYFIYDLLSLLWTKNILFALNKYVTILPMVLIMYFLVDLIYNERATGWMRDKLIDYEYISMGAASLILAAITWVVLLVYGRTYYILRTSLKADYNQYIQAIQLAYILGVFIIAKIKNKYLFPIFVGYNALIIPLFLTSGSRRAYLLILPIFVSSLIIYLVKFKQEKVKTNFIYFPIAIILTAASVFTISESYKTSAQNYYDNLYKEAVMENEELDSQMEHKNEDLIHGFRLENNVDAFYKKIGNGKALDKRNILWSIVFDDLKTFNLKDWIIGRGASYQKNLFEKESSVARIYPEGKKDWQTIPYHPHNFFLVDLINGGIIKVVLVLSALVAAVYYVLINLFKKREPRSIALIIYGFTLMANQMIDSIFGLLENRFTWILFLLIISLNSLYDYKENLKADPKF